MTEAENVVGEPICDGAADLVEFAGEEVSGPFHNNEVVVTRQRGDECFDIRDRAVLVIAPMHEEFRFVALAQGGEIRVIDRNPQADQVRDSWVPAAGAQTHPGTKAKSRDDERHAGKFRLEEV